MLAPGTLLDNRYRLGALLGQGEIAVVYRAHDETVDREVAVKILRSKYATDPDAVRRFRQEAGKAALLVHPAIAQVYETGVDGGLVDVVTQFVDGPDLGRSLAEGGRLAVAEALRIAAEAALALQAAHDKGIVHGDIKPGNILLTSDGDIRVVDFGIVHAPGAAGRSGPGLLRSSAAYSSPEQVLGEPLKPPSDVYSLGVVLYELLTGRRPFEDGAQTPVALRRLGDLPPPPSHLAPDLPADLDQVVLRALTPNPEDRYPSAQALADAIRTWRLTGSAPAVVMSSPMTPRERQRRLALWLIPPVAALFVLAVGWTLGSQGPEDRGGVLGAVASPAAPPSEAPVASPTPSPTASVVLAVVPPPSPTDLLTPTAPPPVRTAGPTAQPPPAATGAPTAPPTRAPTPTPSLAPTPTPTPTPAPTPTPTPEPTPVPTPVSPATVVARFYDLVESHDFDAAASLWTARMRREYPPDKHIDDRFSETTEIEMRRNEVIAFDSEEGEAVVAVIFIEHRDGKRERRIEGFWEMVLSDRGWLMDDRDF